MHAREEVSCKAGEEAWLAVRAHIVLCFLFVLPERFNFLDFLDFLRLLLFVVVCWFVCLFSSSSFCFFRFSLASKLKRS